MNEQPDWYISSIALFQKTGFFDRDPENTVAAAERIIRESDDSYFGNILLLKEDPLFNQILLSYDKKRVWFVEDWMVYGASSASPEHFYAEVLKCLENISNHFFRPENIEIKSCGYCDGRDKRLSISFTLKETTVNLNFCIDGEALILSFLEEVNEILEPTAHSFECILDPYGTCFVFFLHKTQKAYLSTALKWNFHAYSQYWLDKAQFCRDTEDHLNARKYFEKAILDDHNPFAIAEFANFLETQDEIHHTMEVYEKGIRNLKKMQNSDDTKHWWLTTFEERLHQLKTHS